MTHPGDRALIEASLEMAAAVGGDLTPRVYARLLAAQPDVEALFWRDKTGQIRGEMLARVFEAILDFVGERQYAGHLIQTSVVIHTEYGVPPDVFRTFFGVVAETVRDVIGEGWTPEIAAAWGRLLDELDEYVRAGAPV
jgi:hemoglobin-like flavoprotein